MHLLILKLTIILSSILIIATSATKPLDWWQTASFYQIYPRSFQDSNGDGIGDLNGITQKLSYLKSIGIKGTWLSPIFKSPMADFGYDISDYFDIQPEYGTMEDFDNLIRRAKELGIKILLDFVPNHSSDENEWFIKSVNREEGYEDFYVWHNGYPDPNSSTKRLPPSNWISVFRKSAWQWNDQRQQFYLHQFAIKQPDLNYRNPIVAETMKSVLRFWLDRGVDGFRIDAIPFLFEVNVDINDGSYPDEPLSGNTDDPDDYGHLNHIYTNDLNETLDMLYQWRAVLDEYKERDGNTRVIMAETYSPIDIVMRYFGDGKREGAHIPFNFGFITSIYNSSTAYDYASTINRWITKLPAGRTSNWVLGNHDQKRVGSRLGYDRIDLMNMVLMTLPGVSVTYYGEEIGMIDQWISWNDTVDPAACNSNPDIYENFSRDPARTPFQWDSTFNAGFSTANTTWLPVAWNYKTINVKKESDDVGNSHLKVYLDLIALRESASFKFGDLKTYVFNNNVFAILRTKERDYDYVTLVNIGNNTETIDLRQIKQLTKQLIYIIVSVSSKHIIGSKVPTAEVILQPKESFVLKTTASSYSLFSILSIGNNRWEMF